MSKPFVTLELDKIRKLRYGMNALIIIEDLLGRSFIELQENKSFSLKDFRTIIYAGLSHEDKDLTPQLVGDLIDEYSTFEIVSKKMEEAFSAAFGEKK